MENQEGSMGSVMGEVGMGFWKWSLLFNALSGETATIPFSGVGMSALNSGLGVVDKVGNTFVKGNKFKLKEGLNAGLSKANDFVSKPTSGILQVGAGDRISKGSGIHTGSLFNKMVGGNPGWIKAGAAVAGAASLAINTWMLVDMAKVINEAIWDPMKQAEVDRVKSNKQGSNMHLFSNENQQSMNRNLSKMQSNENELNYLLQSKNPAQEHLYSMMNGNKY